MKSCKNVEVVGGFAGKSDDEDGAKGDAGDGGADFLESLQENVGAGAALHALEHVGRGVLQRNVEIFADVVVARDGFEQLAGDAIGVGVEEAQPAEIGILASVSSRVARPSLRPRSSP